MGPPRQQRQQGRRRQQQWTTTTRTTTIVVLALIQISVVVVLGFSPAPLLLHQQQQRQRQQRRALSSSPLYVSNSIFPSPQQQQRQQQGNKGETVSILPPILDTIRDGMSPAASFGTPLDADAAERNRSFVHFCKTFLFDVLYKGKTMDRSYARFYALETIARMPYFSYVSVLHLLETLGHWRRADYLKLHFAESWNELHHLLIMEELLGTDCTFADRFVAQHVAFFYYWIVVGLYLWNPDMAYNLNQAVEEEAYQTYDKFLTRHEAYLKQNPAPSVAVEYYTGNDLYLFDAMHHSSEYLAPPLPPAKDNYGQDEEEPHRRIVKCKTLFDCFVNIRDDEMEHVKTMAYLQQKG